MLGKYYLGLFLFKEVIFVYMFISHLSGIWSSVSQSVFQNKEGVIVYFFLPN